MMKILLTGFETFAEHPDNPSQRLLELLPEVLDNNLYLEKIILPVDHKTAPGIILKKIHDEKPDAVIAFGLAVGRAKICLERVALNLLDFQIPDNAGVVITNNPINPDGPTAYFATLPIRSMLSALTQANIPAEISLSAGTYLCNQVFYSMMHELAITSPKTLAGFVHLPASPETAAKNPKSMPSMDMALIIQAAKILVSCLAAN